MGKPINRETKSQTIERLQDELDDCRRELIKANQERDKLATNYNALYADYTKLTGQLQKLDVEKMKQIYQSLQEGLENIEVSRDNRHENCNKIAALQSQANAFTGSATNTVNGSGRQQAATKEPPDLPHTFLS